MFSPETRADWLGIREIRNLTGVLALLGGGPNQSAALAIGEGLLGRLFGANRPGPDELLSTYAGLRSGSAIILLRLVKAAVGDGAGVIRGAVAACRRAIKQRAGGRQKSDLPLAAGWLALAARFPPALDSVRQTVAGEADSTEVALRLPALPSPTIW